MTHEKLLTPDELRDDLWSIANKVASINHSWFRGIIDRTLSREQVIAGEIQHFLRVMVNKDFFGAIVENAKQDGDEQVLRLEEEVVGDDNHTDLLFQLLDEAGVDRKAAEETLPTVETAIAIEAIIGFCKRHSALEGMAFVAFVEAQNAGDNGVAYPVYRSLVEHYGFSEKAAETFLFHSEIDDKHGNEQIDLICQKANTVELQDKMRRAVRIGTRTFALEWAGHLRAAKNLETK